MKVHIILAFSYFKTLLKYFSVIVGKSSRTCVCSSSTRPVQRARQKASLSSSLDNSLVTRGGLFAQLSKTAKFEEAGALFKYDFHPEEKLAIMSSSLDY